MPIHRSSDLRRGRFSEHSRLYNLTAVTRDRERLFNQWHVGRLLVREFRQAQEMGLANTLAWVAMPDHFHWLIELQRGTLPDLMRRIKSRTAKAVNQYRGASGPVWQPGFHDRAIRREDDIRAVARYIVLNPVRAGLVKRVGDYPLWDAVWV